MGRGKIDFGLLGQRLAKSYLKTQGYRILEENFTCQWGEIDLIALNEGSLVFVEVRTRSSASFLDPLESITAKKLSSLFRSARFYLHTHRHLPQNWRLDCVGVVLEKGSQVRIEVRKDCLTTPR
jgi:putative endonuclease